MKKLKKLDFDQFNRFELTTSHLKNLTGGGERTSRSGIGNGTDGPDWIDECTDKTHFSNGTSAEDDTVE